MYRLLAAALAVMGISACDDAPKRLEPGGSRTETSRLWKQEKSIAADGRYSCVVSGAEPGSFAGAIFRDTLLYRFEFNPDPAPYDAIHRREIARCEEGNKTRPGPKRQCRADPQFRVRFDTRMGGEERYKPGEGLSLVPIEVVTMTDGVTLDIYVPYEGADEVTFEVRPVVTWIENGSPKEEIVTAAIVQRTVGDLAAAAVFAKNCDAFMKGTVP